MDNDKLIDFHETLYFHELDCRDKLTARLQLTLAIITGLAGVVIYIASRVDANAAVGMFCWAIFIVTFALAAVFIAAACYGFIRALWGHIYQCLPLATDVEAYRVELLDAYKDFRGGEATADDYYREFLIKYYAECSSHNANCNLIRYKSLHESASYIVYSIPFLVVAALVFLISDMAKVSRLN